MHELSAHRTPPASADRSVVETAVVAVGTTILFVAAVLAALTAAAAVDGPVLAVTVALFAGSGTLGAGIVGARRVGRRLDERLDRLRATTRSRRLRETTAERSHCPARTD